MQPGHNRLFRFQITRHSIHPTAAVNTHITPLKKLTWTNKKPCVGKPRRTTPVFFAQSRALVKFDTYKGSPQRLPIRPIFSCLCVSACSVPDIDALSVLEC